MKKNIIEEIVEVKGEEWQKAIQGAFNKISKDLTMDGFRKGKVPFDMYVKNRGIESLYMDAVDIAIADVYNDTIVKHKDDIVARPSVDIKDINAEQVTLIFTITTKPEVTLGKYTGLKVKRDSITVTDDEVTAEIDNLIKKYADIIEKTSGTVVDGDVAVIDFEGFHNNVPFAGGKGDNYSLEIGSNTFIPGFEEQVKGMEIGSEKDITVTFPKDYPSEELAGQEVIFKVKVNAIKTKVYPELNADFYKDLNMPDVTNADELNAEIKQNILRHKETNADNKYLDELLETIAANVKVDVPEVMAVDEVERMYQEFTDRLAMQGMNIDMYLQMTNATTEQIKEQMHPEAHKRILYRLVLEAIKDKEKIMVTDQEIEDETKHLAAKYNVEVDEFNKMAGGPEMVKFDLEMRKTIDFIKNNN